MVTSLLGQALVGFAYISTLVATLRAGSRTLYMATHNGTIGQMEGPLILGPNDVVAVRNNEKSSPEEKAKKERTQRRDGRVEGGGHEYGETNKNSCATVSPLWEIAHCLQVSVFFGGDMATEKGIGDGICYYNEEGMYPFLANAKRGSTGAARSVTREYTSTAAGFAAQKEPSSPYGERGLTEEEEEEEDNLSSDSESDDDEKDAESPLLATTSNSSTIAENDVTTPHGGTVGAIAANSRKLAYRYGRQLLVPPAFVFRLLTYQVPRTVVSQTNYWFVEPISSQWNAFWSTSLASLRGMPWSERRRRRQKKRKHRSFSEGDHGEGGAQT